MQDRAFLGLTTLKDLVVKRPQASGEFLQALLEVTMSDIELVGGRGREGGHEGAVSVTVFPSGQGAGTSRG